MANNANQSVTLTKEHAQNLIDINYLACDKLTLASKRLDILEKACMDKDDRIRDLERSLLFAAQNGPYVQAIKELDVMEEGVDHLLFVRHTLEAVIAEQAETIDTLDRHNTRLLSDHSALNLKYLRMESANEKLEYDLTARDNDIAKLCQKIRILRKQVEAKQEPTTLLKLSKERQRKARPVRRPTARLLSKTREAAKQITAPTVIELD